MLTSILVHDQLKDASAIERRLLALAHTTDAKITAPTLAFFAPCSIDDAARVLEELAARDRLTMEIEDDGTIVYHLLGRQKLTPAVTPAGMPTLAPAMVRFARPPRPEASPLAAALLSVMIPGAGHLYTGRVAAAFLWFLVVSMGYVLILPGLVLHLFSVASAATSARRLNASSHLALAAAT